MDKSIERVFVHVLVPRARARTRSAPVTATDSSFVVDPRRSCPEPTDRRFRGRARLSTDHKSATDRYRFGFCCRQQGRADARWKVSVEDLSTVCGGAPTRNLHSRVTDRDDPGRCAGSRDEHEHVHVTRVRGRSDRRTNGRVVDSRALSVAEVDRSRQRSPHGLLIRS